MLAKGLPVGQKTDDAVMRRVLKTRDQRHRLVPRAVDQNLTAVRAAGLLQLDQVVDDDHAKTKGQQKEERDQHVQQETHGKGGIRWIRFLGKEKHVEEHQQVLEENRTAQFPDFPKRRMTDDAAERSENDERKNAQNTRTGQQPETVPYRENRIREQSANQQVGDQGRNYRHDRVDRQDQPRRKIP